MLSETPPGVATGVTSLGLLDNDGKIEAQLF